MISQSYTQTASGLIVPRSNGFANRIILDQVGSGTRTLPEWAKSAKVALMGAAGSGALSLYDGNNSSNVTYPVSAGGGGPLSIAFLDLAILGRAFNFVLGPGGAAPTSTGGGNAGIVGNSGAVSSVVWGSRTLTANPGQGGKLGPSNSLAALTGGLGGTATGGDFNFSGGDGGAWPARPGISRWQAPGGGSSGRPWGDGTRGGQTPVGATFLQDGSLPGGSWGFSGEADRSFSTGSGHGVLGRGSGNFPGAGRGSFVSPNPSFASGSISPNFAGPPIEPWWDLDEVCGWGAGLSTIVSAQNTTYYYVPHYAGPGGSGAGAPNGPYPDLARGGFGAGGGGNQSQGQNNGGGNGGGGGATVASGSNVGNYQGGKGGDPYLIVWFN